MFTALNEPNRTFHRVQEFLEEERALSLPAGPDVFAIPSFCHSERLVLGARNLLFVAQRKTYVTFIAIRRVAHSSPVLA